ncbi:transcriptional regulator [Flavobacterium sp. CYK-4]|uniref:SRPBCC family protein n=1 Tax=Flavobacterium lotistagni TaxID=2709660 RepID=UPI00140A248A|nr:SRPBCC family protein [Flavobacterium lotistagni]NHM07058.1 transcriptional regulator [Flavobacterium lotistagni]
MTILKYLFLLLLLALFATTVYVATLDGNFEVTTSAVIKSPRATLFNFVNDYRNWETFVSWKKEDPSAQFFYPGNTVGKGGSYSWKSNEGDGDMTTTAIQDGQSISQKVHLSGAESSSTWVFKDTVGGTKIIWRSKGKMSFKYKMYALFKGGASETYESNQQKTLAQLEKTLAYEINTYKIKVNGLVKKTGTFYLKQSINSKIEKIASNLRIMIPRMIRFTEKNKITTTGHPFVIYHTYDTVNGVSNLSVCIPVKEEIHISEGSDMSSGLLYPFQAVKTTLIGDYSHTREAWSKTRDYLKKNYLTENLGGTALEIYSTNMVQVANPSKWVTEIYVPIKAQAPAALVNTAATSVPLPTTAPVETTSPETNTP